MIIRSNIIESLIPKSFIRLYRRVLGTYEAPIWFHIKIFIDNNNSVYSCFIDNDMIYSSNVNVNLMKKISRKLKLHLEKKSVNWICPCKIEPICDYLRDLNLNVSKTEANKNLIIITVNGKLSEKDIKLKSKTKK